MNVTVGEALDMMAMGFCLEINAGRIGNFVREDEAC